MSQATKSKDAAATKRELDKTYDLARRYLEGDGVAKDETRAVKSRPPPTGRRAVCDDAWRCGARRGRRCSWPPTSFRRPTPCAPTCAVFSPGLAARARALNVRARAARPDSCVSLLVARRSAPCVVLERSPRSCASSRSALSACASLPVCASLRVLLLAASAWRSRVGVRRLCQVVGGRARETGIGHDGVARAWRGPLDLLVVRWR